MSSSEQDAVLISFIKKVADGLFSGSLESSSTNQGYFSSSLKLQPQELKPEDLIAF